MNIEREIKVRDAIKYCIENFDSQTATNRIVEFWKDELKLQEQQFNIANVVEQIEQLKAEDKDLPFADYLEKWYKLPRYEKVYDRKDGKGTDTEDEVIKNYKRAFRL